jgi:hypothetical protein
MANDLTVEEIANLFKLADQDKNGKLSRDEIILIMKQLKDGKQPSDDEINNCMRTMDANGDGVISEQEFLHAMITWLGIVEQTTGQKRQFDGSSPSSSSHRHRKKTLQNMANFFLQFSPVSDYHDKQQRILHRQRHDDFDLTAVHREYGEYSIEVKLKMFEMIEKILFEGREVLLNELYSMDWQRVLSGIVKVNTLLSIVEVFPSPEEKYALSPLRPLISLSLSVSLSLSRFEFSSSVFQIFDGVSQIDQRFASNLPTLLTLTSLHPCPPLLSRESTTQCIIRRVCGLLSPSVPLELQPAVYSLCMTCLRNFITGPGLTPPLFAHLDENNIWSQHSSFTRHVVESEGLPHRLLAILDQFYLDQNSYLLTTSFRADPLSVELIVHLLRCLSAFCEENTGCLEGMLRIGARAKVIRLLSMEQFFQLPVLRSGLGCLAVLCGYSHTFQQGHREGKGGESGETRNSIPSALCLDAKELFDLLSLLSTLLSRFIALSSASADFDPTVTLNCGIICRYLLPLCSPQDPLYQVCPPEDTPPPLLCLPYPPEHPSKPPPSLPSSMDPLRFPSSPCSPRFRFLSPGADALLARDL